MRVLLSMIIRDSVSLTEFSVSYGCLRINETNGKDKLAQTHDWLVFRHKFLYGKNELVGRQKLILKIQRRMLEKKGYCLLEPRGACEVLMRADLGCQSHLKIVMYETISPKKKVKMKKKWVCVRR